MVTTLAQDLGCLDCLGGEGYKHLPHVWTKTQPVGIVTIRPGYTTLAPCTQRNWMELIPRRHIVAEEHCQWAWNVKQSKSSLCARCCSLGGSQKRVLWFFTFMIVVCSKGAVPLPGADRQYLRPWQEESSRMLVEMTRIPKVCLHQLIQVNMCLAVERIRPLVCVEIEILLQRKAY